MCVEYFSYKLTGVDADSPAPNLPLKTSNFTEKTDLLILFDSGWYPQAPHAPQPTDTLTSAGEACGCGRVCGRERRRGAAHA